MRVAFIQHRVVRAAIVLQSVAALSLATNAHAQQSTTRGLSLGVALQGTSLEVEGGDANSGGSLGLRVGYGFNRIVTGFVHVDGGEIDVSNNAALGGTWAMGHAEIGARFHFANSLRKVVPWLETSLGARVVSVENARANGEDVGKVTFNGGAFTLGGGISAYFKPSLALDVGLKLTGGTFTEVDLGNVSVRNIDIDAKSARFAVGLVWWP
jgi:hypothetical protein